MTKLNKIISAASYVVGISSMILDNHKRIKPEWERKFEFYEGEIADKTGLSKRKLREVIEIMKEYEVLEREGKRY
ncbi:hypothetical protein [Paenibacillus cremeus]|uniref:Uncharacterized protein n=1 Tax=Paenibacillus cremeus TaxID=2163881 RepID=A0A559KCU1_9BACL|nr:hypothetical protein [Paenibacillus cremeus]TVY09945.1 hypothetical protein FPZ49_11275 [Paenibacillus cremeus]